MREISKTTYTMFMKRYRLKLMKRTTYGKYKYKTMKEMQHEIYSFEEENNIIDEGLYFQQ